jgi:hypothetical protein
MAVAPSPEDSARYILSIFGAHNLRAGHVLSQRNFVMPFAQAPWQASDFKPGMDYAIDKKWIEITDKGDFSLTPLGFSEA